MGCGRIFEGDAESMWGGLQKILALPGTTTVYCGHEYTAANGRFALTIEPENDALAKRMAEVTALRAEKQSDGADKSGAGKSNEPVPAGRAAWNPRPPGIGADA